jgi:hypothetical protein
VGGREPPGDALRRQESTCTGQTDETACGRARGDVACMEAQTLLKGLGVEPDAL